MFIEPIIISIFISTAKRRRRFAVETKLCGVVL